MTARRAGVSLALITGVALLVAACGGSGPTSTPNQTPTQAPESQAAPSFDLSSFDLGSFALPSFTSDAELEALFPTSLGGHTLTVRSMSGTDFMAFGGSNNTMGPALEQLGKTPADLSVAFGGTTDGSVLVFAFRIKGVDAEDFMQAFTSTAGSTSGSTITDASVAGKSVKKVLTSGQTVYLYTHGDVVWTVGGTPSAAVLDEAFSKLP